MSAVGSEVVSQKASGVVTIAFDLDQRIVVPAPGEAFSTWLDRLAASWQCSLAMAARRVGLTDALGWEPGRRPKRLGVAIKPEIRDRVARESGVAAEVIDAMHLSSFHGRALDLSNLEPHSLDPLPAVLLVHGGGCLRLTPWTGRTTPRPVRDRQENWWLDGHSRVCPQCLAQRPGIWQASWRLGGVAVCTEHHRVLLDICGRCNLPIRSGGRAAPPPIRGQQAFRALLECGNRRRGNNAICRQRLDELPPGADVPWAVTRVQQMYLRAAAGSTVKLGERKVPARNWSIIYEAMVKTARDAIAYDPECFLSLDYAIDGSDDVKELYAAEYRDMPDRPITFEDGLPMTAALTAAIMMALLPVLLQPRLRRVDEMFASLLRLTYGEAAANISFEMNGRGYLTSEQWMKIYRLQDVMERQVPRDSGMVVDME